MRCTKQPSNLGSSETTREAPLINFDFSSYFQTAQPDHIQLKDTKFLQWFIGFSEGDGCFLISKNRCSFIINQKEIALLYNIRTRLGFGKVTLYTQNDQTYGRYHVQCKKNCLRLATLFNGNLVLEKTNQKFTKWLEILKISKLENVGKVSLTNGWLSGFINGSGYFYTRIRKNSRTKLGFQFLQKFILIQRSEFETLERIQMLLCSQSRVQMIKNKNRSETIYYKLEISSMSANQLLLNYLTQYPNLGQKQVNIKVYQRLNGYMQRKEHLTELGLSRMQKLSNQLRKHTQKQKQLKKPLLLPSLLTNTKVRGTQV